MSADEIDVQQLSTLVEEVKAARWRCDVAQGKAHDARLLADEAEDALSDAQRNLRNFVSDLTIYEPPA